MKVKSYLNISVSVISTAVLLCMAVMPINGDPLIAIRAGEEYIAHNPDMDKQVEIELNGQVIDSLPVGVVLRGDADHNKKVNIFDATTVAKYTVGALEIDDFPNTAGGFAGNVNGDGKINIFDAVAIAKYTVSGESDPAEAWKKALGN